MFLTGIYKNLKYAVQTKRWSIWTAGYYWYCCIRLWI